VKGQVNKPSKGSSGKGEGSHEEINIRILGKSKKGKNEVLA